MTEKNKNIPELRFPEFDGEWKEKTLGSISTFSKGKGLSKDDIDKNGVLECIRYGELYTNYNETIRNVISSTNINVKELVLSQNGDVIIPASGETQIDIATASCVLKDGVALGGDINIIRSNADGVFLAFYLNNKKRIDIARLSQGISVVHLYASQLKSLIIFYPLLAEQQKIASFLTSVDERIQKLTKKKELLEKYKKGIMQKIFSQQIRFKDDDGNDFPDWERKRLDEISQIIGGGTPDTNKSEFWNGEINWLTPTEIKNKYISKSLRTITKLGLKNSSAKILPKGAILFTSRATIGDVGIASESFATNQGFQSFITNESTDNEFLYYLIIKNKNKFLRKANGSTFLEISSSEIKKMKLDFPIITEQQRISNFLSSIDKKIDSVATQLEKTKTFKKGLLLKMFV